MRKRHYLLLPLSLLLAALACTLPSLTTPAPPPTMAIPTAISSIAPVLPTPPAESTTAFALGELDLADLYERVYRGVVTIWTFSNAGQSEEADNPTGQGSGFVIDMDGHVVTNFHVVLDADEIEVDFATGYKAWATVLGTDPDSDLALLKVDVPADVLVPLTLGDSRAVRVGEFVVAIGNPFGLSGSMTVGIVSAIGRTLGSERSAPTGGSFSAGDIIQTDAAINPGNSGGPLLNIRGEVIGVNRAIFSESFTVEGSAANSGVGFAVPVNIVKRVVPSLIAEGEYDYPYLGITSLGENLLNLKTLDALGLPQDATGAYVTCVTAGGPADEGGVVGAGPCNSQDLRPGGDLIIAIDGHRIVEFGDLISYLVSETGVGQQVTLTVLRDGQELDIAVTIGARP
ncbi:MAG TPA: trypsin-like peptidase domain-containing protein [Anaerolineales bacterium]|nr:trypsin-like peptidase domain-containing protein [Anaerolineales bacterium]